MFHKVVAVEPRENYTLFATFEDGSTRLYDVKRLFPKWEMFLPLKDEALFRSVKLAPGGYAVIWNADIDLACDELYYNGENKETA